VAVILTENRRFQRVRLSLAVSGKCLEKRFRGYKFQGETQDASFDGLCLKIFNSHCFKTGQEVNLNTRLYEGDFLIRLKGIICWVSAQDNHDRPASVGVKLTRFRRFGLWCERIENRMVQA
jgi:hypothetical protein